jgi:hypothetical protein
VLIDRRAPADGADLVLKGPKAARLGLLAGSTQGMEATGDLGVLRRLTAVLQAPDPDFAVVTP